MLQMMMGGKVYEAPSFKQTMDSRYYPLENMMKSVAFLKNRDDIDIETMQFGQYQPLLAPEAVQANKSPKFWWQEMGRARASLAKQPNTDVVYKGYNGFVPLTKCDLLDACIRQCFCSEPPICMNVNVTQKSPDDPNPDQHGIDLQWEYNGDVPVLLVLTMICPYLPPKSK